MTDYVRGSNPIWYMVDLVGQQFDDTFYMYVLTNTVPYIPQAVYHSPTGTPWANPIQFNANGTLPTDIFFDPTLVYRLEFRHNVGPLPPSQADPLIYLIEDYSPNGDASLPIDVSGISTENQISNSQFVEMTVNTPYTLTGVPNPPDIEVAPGWFLSLVGNGTVDIARVPLDDSTPTPTNAPYALQINLGAGWTSLPVLYQRFSQNGVLWANKYIASSMTARINGPSQNVTTRIDNSMGSPVLILGIDSLTNEFVEYKNVALMPASMNSDIPPDAYMDFKIVLPTVADIYITSLQLVSLNADAEVSYQQDSVDRQVDHLFHYYKDKLAQKPIPSYLTGWDFPLNPAQFTGSTVAASAIGANKSKYVWDQTIVYQSADSSIGVTRSAAGDLVLTADVTGQTAIIQYLDATQARRLLSDNIAVNFAASTSNVGGLVGTVSLWATDDVALPNVAAGTNNSIVLTLDANGKPATRNGVGWVEVPRSNFGDAKFTLSSTMTEYDFNGWDMSGNALVDTATFFAIVIGFATVTNPGTVDIKYVGLCSGDIATRPAPLTPQETLSNCEQYYEKSYTNGSFAGAVTSVNALTRMQSSRILGANASNFIANQFTVDYRTVKRSNTPTVALYTASTGAAGNVDATIKTVGTVTSATNSAVIAISQWTIANLGDRTFTYLPNYGVNANPNVACNDSFEEIVRSWITFHYVIDARLGIV